MKKFQDTRAWNLPVSENGSYWFYLKIQTPYCLPEKTNRRYKIINKNTRAMKMK